MKKVSGKVDAIKWMEENNGYPRVDQVEDKKSLQKFYKQLSDEQLADWCALEGLEYKPCPDQAPIHRMRMAMAILYFFYPKESSATTKKKSKYSDYTTEALIQLAVDSEVPVEVTEDMRIMRMRTIMALRAAKVIE